MIVEEHCPLIEQTVEEAGLRHLPGLFLVEIDRRGHVITPVGPDQLIRPHDRLVFAGVISTIVELQRIRGLVPTTDDEGPVHASPEHRLMEAVVSASSPLIDQSIRDANFRTAYDAAVIAVHRNGERVQGKIGKIVLEAGDTLLLQGAAGFLRAHRNSPDFYLVSEVAGTETPRYDRAGVAIGILLMMVLAASLGIYPIAIAAFLACALLIATRSITGGAARRSVDWSILIVIGASFGVALAMQKTGAATAIASLIANSLEGTGPFAALIVIYLTTLFLSELLHHNAAVAMMFPIAVETAHLVGANPRAFVMAVAIAGACAFASPVTYQTHLIVYGPGGYRFTDFVRVGLPLNAICAGIAIALIPIFWPF
jgi:di/tricarboxylate transporter